MNLTKEEMQSAWLSINKTANAEQEKVGRQVMADYWHYLTDRFENEEVDELDRLDDRDDPYIKVDYVLHGRKMGYQLIGFKKRGPKKPPTITLTHHRCTPIFYKIYEHLVKKYNLPLIAQGFKRDFTQEDYELSEMRLTQDDRDELEQHVSKLTRFPYAEYEVTPESHDEWWVVYRGLPSVEKFNQLREMGYPVTDKDIADWNKKHVADEKMIEEQSGWRYPTIDYNRK